MTKRNTSKKIDKKIITVKNYMKQVEILFYKQFKKNY